VADVGSAYTFRELEAVLPASIRICNLFQTNRLECHPSLPEGSGTKTVLNIRAEEESITGKVALKYAGMRKGGAVGVWARC
jgi:hypothetical protein